MFVVYNVKIPTKFAILDSLLRGGYFLTFDPEFWNNFYGIPCALPPDSVLIFDAIVVLPCFCPSSPGCGSLYSQVLLTKFYYKLYLEKREPVESIKTKNDKIKRKGAGKAWVSTHVSSFMQGKTQKYFVAS